MNLIETNIFPILNLEDLTASYRVYRIRGLQADHPEYFQNRQAIAKRMSYALRTPALVLDSAEGPTLIVRSDAESPEPSLELVRTTVCFDELGETHDIDFRSKDPQHRQIAMRFLQFMVQAPLSTHPLLWQPGAGKPFYEKSGESDRNGVTRYTGFSVRVMPNPQGALGLCVDVASKFVSSMPLPDRITHQEFRPYKGRHVVYQYGHRWYEVRLHELSELSVSEFRIPGEGTLLDFIVKEVQKPAPPEIGRLNSQSSVVLYQTNTGQLRGAPAALCFPVLDSYQAPRFAGKKRLYEPHERRQLTQRFLREYVSKLSFGRVHLSVSSTALSTEQRIFQVPDFEFGNGRILSTCGTPGAQHVSLDSLGQVRAALLRDKNAGFYSWAPRSSAVFHAADDIGHLWHAVYAGSSEDNGRNVSN